MFIAKILQMYGADPYQNIPISINKKDTEKIIEYASFEKSIWVSE